MNITRHDTQGIATFILEGRVDSTGAVELDEALQAAAAEDIHKMVLDMAEVTYMNSAGLRTLADILTRNRANDGDLLLVATNPKVERVFKIIGFDKFFNTFDTIDKALAHF
jgi:anti-sigma B factor antagonist